jgi:signal transduction histidine kinase
MPTGGTLTIQSDLVHLDGNYAAAHFATRPGPYVALTVTDTGVGIKPDVQPHLFEPFFTTKEVGKGTGLGLDTAKRLLHRHDGEIDVESAPGRTVFEVRLPIAR